MKSSTVILAFASVAAAFPQLNDLLNSLQKGGNSRANSLAAISTSNVQNGNGNGNDQGQNNNNDNNNNNNDNNDADIQAEVNAVAIDDGEANIEIGDDESSGALNAKVNAVANDEGEANLEVGGGDDVDLAADIQGVDGGKVNVAINGN